MEEGKTEEERYRERGGGERESEKLKLFLQKMASCVLARDFVPAKNDILDWCYKNWPKRQLAEKNFQITN